jgi:dual specificity phosphatase 12
MSGESASRILPWLFVSGRDFATKRESLRNENITHIVFCTTGSSEQFADVGLRYLTLRFEDDERSELAPMVVLATDFVGTARANGGRVLIVSDRAISRSAAVATGVLVQLLNISLRDAFSLVRDAHKKARPIPAFVNALKRQLAHYPIEETLEKDANVVSDEKNNDDDNDNNDNEDDKVVATTATTSDDDAAASSAIVAAATTTTSDSTTQKPFCYSCRMCGQALFKPEHIRDHDKMDGGQSYTFEGKVRDNIAGADIDCRSFFIEHLKWMSLPEGEIEGKLTCPKCKGKLGSWSWRGVQCACGRWCTPAFRIMSDRVDARWSIER